MAISAPAAIAGAAIALAIITSACSGSRTEQPVMASAQPLSIQVVRATTTKAPQFDRQVKATLSNLDLSAATVPGYVYRGPIKEEISSIPIPLKGTESFVIVDFIISGISQKTQVNRADIQLVDRNGVAYTTLGLNDPKGVPSKDKPWISFSSFTMDPAISSSDNQKWLFEVPNDSLAGLTVRFQGKNYPLTL